MLVHRRLKLYQNRAAVLVVLSGACLVTPAVANNYDCSFNVGAGHVFEGGQFQPQGAGRLAFGIADINMDAQSATLVTERGRGQLKIVHALGATHFIEVATEGYLYLTTVYDKDAAGDSYPAVHSRHSGVVGQPLVTQLVGSCRGK